MRARQETPFAPPAQRLNRYPQILLEAYRIHDMPAVHRVPMLGLVGAIRPEYLMHAQKRR